MVLIIINFLTKNIKNMKSELLSVSGGVTYKGLTEVVSYVPLNHWNPFDLVWAIVKVFAFVVDWFLMFRKRGIFWIWSILSMDFRSQKIEEGRQQVTGSREKLFSAILEV